MGDCHQRMCHPKEGRHCSDCAVPAGRSNPRAETVHLDAETVEALGAFQIKAGLREGVRGGGSISTEAFAAERVSVAKVATQGLSTWQSRNPENFITISLGVSGHYGGTVQGRPYASRDGKLNFVSMPNDIQDALIGTEEAVGWLLNFSCEELLRECKSLGQDDCPVRLLGEALDGSESFLESASQHLLWLKYAQPQAWHQSSIASTQAAMVSFVAARMISRSDRIPATALPTAHQLASYVDLAISYMEQSLKRPIGLGDLCEACHVSARTLQIAFRQLRDETPMQALRGLRLKQMRAFLLQGEDVSVACLRSGLSPTGRTSALYFTLYGEKPSQTSAGFEKGLFRSKS